MASFWMSWINLKNPYSWLWRCWRPADVIDTLGIFNKHPMMLSLGHSESAGTGFLDAWKKNRNVSCDVDGSFVVQTPCWGGWRNVSDVLEAPFWRPES